jgi:hypothetical protein
MCTPVAAAAVMIGATILDHVEQAKEAGRQNEYAAQSREAAQQAFLIELSDIWARQGEERQAAVYQRQEGMLLAQRSAATATVAAAEAGVAGLSVDLLLGDIDRQRGEHAVSVEQNLRLKQRQLQREERGAKARKAARIAGIPTFSGPSIFGTGARIATIGVQAATQAKSREPDA